MNHCPKCSDEISAVRRYLTPGRISCRKCRAVLKVNQSLNLKWATFGISSLVVGLLAILADRGMNSAFAVLAVAALTLMIWSAAQGEIVEHRDPSFRQFFAALEAIAKSPGRSLIKGFLWFIETVALVVFFMVGVGLVIIGANAA
jgi:hypothetical protein